MHGGGIVNVIEAWMAVVLMPAELITIGLQALGEPLADGLQTDYDKQVHILNKNHPELMKKMNEEAEKLPYAIKATDRLLDLGPTEIVRETGVEVHTKGKQIKESGEGIDPSGNNAKDHSHSTAKDHSHSTAKGTKDHHHHTAKGHSHSTAKGHSHSTAKGGGSRKRKKRRRRNKTLKKPH
jgi:hypothetical protein